MADGVPLKDFIGLLQQIAAKEGGEIEVAIEAGSSSEFPVHMGSPLVSVRNDRTDVRRVYIS